MLAPNSPSRAAATAHGLDAADDLSAYVPLASPPDALAPNARSPARYFWAMLMTRLFQSLPLTCPNCGEYMRIIAFITEATPVEPILVALGEPSCPPPIAPARGPPAWDNPKPIPDWDLLKQPELDVEFDQRIAW